MLTCGLLSNYAFAENSANCAKLQSGHGTYGHLSTAKITFPCMMQNNNYSVAITLTNSGPKSVFYVSNKSKSGFQLHSDVAGVGTQTFDWIVVQD